MIFCFVRETKLLTLEELDQVFSIPTRKFIHYEATVWLPWFIKRYFFFQRIPRPAPLLERSEKLEIQTA